MKRASDAVMARLRNGASAHLGQLTVKQSRTSLHMDWTLPLEMTSVAGRNRSPLLFFVEAKEDDEWTCISGMHDVSISCLEFIVFIQDLRIRGPRQVILTKPTVNVTHQCESKRLHLVAVNSDGLIGVSPETTFHCEHSQKLL